MLLRSVTKHVTEQNWFAVILDLVIVVFGVFIGIEVANWNTERAGEEKAKVLVQRLHTDLGNDLEALTQLLDYIRIVRNYTITAVDGLNGVPAVSDEQLVIAAYQSSQISTPWNYRSTFNELLSTGQVDLIENDELKALIFGYYSENWSEQDTLKVTAPYREYIRSTLPFLIQDTIRKECGDITIRVADTFATTLPESCDLELPNELFAKTAAQLRLQPETLSKLRFQIAVYESQATTMENFKEEARLLMAAIEESQK